MLRIGSIVVVTALLGTLASGQEGGPSESEAKKPVTTEITPLLERAIEQTQRRLELKLDLGADHSTWETAWVVETEHFAVRRLGSYIKARTVGARLEKLLSRLETDLGVEIAASAPKFRIWILPDLAAYRAFGDEHGEEHSSMFGSFHAKNHPESPLATFEEPQWLPLHVAHSAVHQYLARAFPSRTLPTWLEEGLATYYSIDQQDLMPWAIDQFEAQRDERFVPIADLLDDTIADYAQQSEADRRMRQLGITLWYLFEVRDDTRTRDAETGPFRAFVRAVLAGADPSGMGLDWLTRDSADRRQLEVELKTEDLRLAYRDAQRRG